MSEWVLLAVLALFGFLTSLLLIYPLVKQQLVYFIFLPLIFVFAMTGYMYWGSFGLWRAHQHALRAQQMAEQIMHSINGPKELIAKLRAKLTDGPQSAKGWYLLGRLYLSQGESAAAVSAFAKAYAFKPQNTRFAVNYAQSLWENNHQQFNPEIRKIFSQVLKQNPNQADALAMLAVDAYARGDYPLARTCWKRLLTLVPEGSEEAKAIRLAIGKMGSAHPTKKP